MKNILVALIAVFSFSFAPAQKVEQYSRVQVFFDKEHGLKQLAGLGIAVDHGEFHKNVSFTSDFSATEIKAIKNAGFKVEILIADVVKHYQDQNKKKDLKGQQKTTNAACDTSHNPHVTIPTHFHLGTYGGYFTYAEMLQILDSMQLLYPGLISAKQAIDTFHSIEGRPIYWLRVSNNPTVAQPAKPQMLYTSVHHAREPGSLSSNIFYLWYLLENYNTNPQIKAIIDNTELYFIPCINPDGYIYNETTNPGGGGMWRKNRRDNGDGTYGIDINRNYGYNWAYDTFGSSPHSYSETYRGLSAFSEPETRAVKWFAEHHQFQMNLNYHTYHNTLIYPWGYIGSFLTPDSTLFDSYGNFLTKYSHYLYGTCDKMLGYIVNGSSDDWMYGEQSSKIKALAMTPEIGESVYGFYPPDYLITPYCMDNLLANVNIASLLLPYGVLRNSESSILTQQNGYLHYSLQRLGLANTGTYTVSIQSLDNRLSVSPTPKVYSSLNLLQLVKDSISYTINTGTPNGTMLKYVLKLNNGLYDLNDTIQVYYGQYSNSTSPTSNVTTNWINNGWGTCTSTYYSAPSSIKSSVNGIGNYVDAADITITLKDTIDLTKAYKAYLEFYTKWDIEIQYDYAEVEATEYMSFNWQPQCGKYTRPGSMYQSPASIPGSPIYDGTQSEWVLEQIDLSDFIGQKINIQFHLVSDPASNRDGFYFDDLKIVTVKDTALGLPLNVAKGSINVYPNPACNQMTVSFNKPSFAGPVSGILYDCMGRAARTFEFSEATTTVDTRQLPFGVYYLKVFDKEQTIPVQKVIIEK